LSRAGKACLTGAPAPALRQLFGSPALGAWNDNGTAAAGVADFAVASSRTHNYKGGALRAITASGQDMRGRVGLTRGWRN